MMSAWCVWWVLGDSGMGLSEGGLTSPVCSSSFSSSLSTVRSVVRASCICIRWLVLIHGLRAGDELRQAFDPCFGPDESFELSVSSRAQQGSLVEVSWTFSYDVMSHLYRTSASA